MGIVIASDELSSWEGRYVLVTPGVMPRVTNCRLGRSDCKKKTKHLKTASTTVFTNKSIIILLLYLRNATHENESCQKLSAVWQPSHVMWIINVDHNLATVRTI